MNNIMMMLSRNKPGIMLGLGIGSMLTSIFTGVLYSPMARDAIEERKEELNVDKLEPLEVIKTAGPYFVPTIAFAGTGIAFIVCGNKINLERQAAAMTACAISETTSQIYREKVKDIVGEKKEKTIHEAAAKEMYNRDYNSGNILVVNGNSNGFPMYDTLTKQRFKSNIEKVHSSINNLNRRMFTEKVTMDEYCLVMGEEPMELGKILGWDFEHGFIELEPFTAVVNEYGEPEIVITHRNIPRQLY